MGVPEPLEEEMRMSESISLPNGVAVKVQSLLFLHASAVLVLGKETQQTARRGTRRSPSGSKINKEQLKYGEKLPGASISHAVL